MTAAAKRRFDEKVVDETGGRGRLAVNEEPDRPDGAGLRRRIGYLDGEEDVIPGCDAGREELGVRILCSPARRREPSADQ